MVGEERPRWKGEVIPGRENSVYIKAYKCKKEMTYLWEMTSSSQKQLGKVLVEQCQKMKLE